MDIEAARPTGSAGLRKHLWWAETRRCMPARCAAQVHIDHENDHPAPTLSPSSVPQTSSSFPQIWSEEA